MNVSAFQNSTIPTEQNWTLFTDDPNSMATDESRQFYTRAQFVTGLLCYPVICTIGLIGNALSLVVLTNKDMRSSTTVFLIALAVSDSIKLINDILYFINTLLLTLGYQYTANTMMGYLYPVSHYIFNSSLCSTAWLTVCIAVERYIHVCRPSEAKVVCTIRRSSTFVKVIFVVMMLLSLPSAFRYKGIVVFDEHTNATRFDIVKSHLGRNIHFVTVYSWVLNLIRSVIPLLILAFYNIYIVHTLWKKRTSGKKMLARNRITFMLIVVILVFLLCVTPDAILSTIFSYGYADESYFIRGIREITDTLLAINSGVNFIIYCVFSKVFRRKFVEIICKKKHPVTIEIQPPSDGVQNDVVIQIQSPSDIEDVNLDTTGREFCLSSAEHALRSTSTSQNKGEDIEINSFV